MPIEFLEIELAVLEEMGLVCERSPEYAAANGRTRLVDLTTKPSMLHAPIDKIHPMPFPGLNIDNLPFFALIAATAEGTTLVHDWVYENRALHLTEMTKLGAKVALMDPHRLHITGPTHWSAAEVICPPALRPAVVDPARDARREGHVGAAQRLHDQPGLRAARRTPHRAGRVDRGLPRPVRR